jgi:DMSO/TMAO reductase YedYZ molybdopterin-dependent catalytic subunit
MNKKQNQPFRTLIFTLMIALTITLTACSTTPNVDWELSVSGAVSNPTVFTYKELADLPQVDLQDVLMEKSRGEDEFRSFSGVKLSLILEKVGAQDNLSSITAKAADGYAIEISEDELVDGIVALKDGNDWIVNSDPKSGPIRLVFPATPANRWVFQVNEIIVNP